MRLKNPWFELLTFITAVFWAGGAVNTIINHVRGGPRDLLPTVLTVATFLILALVFFRASWHLGTLQAKIRRMKKSSTALTTRKVVSGDQPSAEQIDSWLDRIAKDSEAENPKSANGHQPPTPSAADKPAR
jgi:hypothetical protein